MHKYSTHKFFTPPYLKGGGRILQNSNQVSNTYFHKLWGGFQMVSLNVTMLALAQQTIEFMVITFLFQGTP